MLHNRICQRVFGTCEPWGTFLRQPQEPEELKELTTYSFLQILIYVEVIFYIYDIFDINHKSVESDDFYL